MDPLLNDLDFKFDPNDIDKDDDDEMAFAIETTLGNGGGIFNTNNLNPYSYGYNDPVRFDDPDGRCPICLYVIAALVYSEFAMPLQETQKQILEIMKPLKKIKLGYR